MNRLHTSNSIKEEWCNIKHVILQAVKKAVYAKKDLGEEELRKYGQKKLNSSSSKIRSMY